MCIYLITNKINGEKYVGQTIRTLKQRWEQHCQKSSCRKLSDAIKKYGKENFKIEVIEECKNRDELNEKENKRTSF